MKRIFLFLSLLISFVAASGQATLNFRADTIKIWKNGGYATLLVQNNTKDTTGLGYNAGNGELRFKTPYAINDSTLVLGNDTIVLNGSGTGGVGDTVNYVATYYRLYKVADSIMALVDVAGDDWGDQNVVTTAYLVGVGTDADSLSVNLDSFYTKYQVDSIAAALSLAGGADNWGTQEVVTDNYTILRGGVVGDSLHADTTVLVTYRAMDSLIGTIPTADKFPTITGTNLTGTLTNLTDKFSPDATIKSYIDQQAVASGTTLTGWVNLYDVGAISGATYTTGTDNITAWNTAVSTVQAGGTIYIPRGSFYFSSPPSLPGNKSIKVLVDGDTYFRTGNGFIIDGYRQYFEHNGSIFGTNQTGTINYGSQSNIGVWVRNTTNSKVILSQVMGFKYGVQIGGYATGTSIEQGSQFNDIWFKYLRRNSVGIYFHPSGGTTSSRGNWANANDVFCGQISGDTALIFRKDVTQLDRFNGNTLYSFRPEHGGSTTIPMKLGIYVEFAVSQNFVGGRFESGDITEKLYATNDVDNLHFDGFDYWAWQWLANPGNNISINGPIYDQVSGICVGMSAMGYRFSSTSTFFNKRVRIFGTTRSPSAMANVPSNIDVEYTNETSVNVTAATYSVQPGIKTVRVNYASGTAIITLPLVSLNPDRRVVVKNMSATQSVTVFGPAGGEPITLSPKSAIEYEASGGQWISINSRGTVT
jgi:hypothetical protein